MVLRGVSIKASYGRIFEDVLSCEARNPTRQQGRKMIHCASWARIEELNFGGKRMKETEWRNDRCWWD
jgi:hypothetical protein